MTELNRFNTAEDYKAFCSMDNKQEILYVIKKFYQNDCISMSDAQYIQYLEQVRDKLRILGYYTLDWHIREELVNEAKQN